MKKIYSKIDPSLLLHQITKLEDIVLGRVDITDPKEFIQASALRPEEGKIFRPHKHFWRDGEKQMITQECWIVIKGKIKCSYYDTDNALLGEEILGVGDASVTYQGGHSVQVLEKDTIFYEVKPGPYKGREQDNTSI